MLTPVSLLPLGLAAALFVAPATAQADAGVQTTQEQGDFVLHLGGLTAANAAQVQTALAKVPTVTSVTVDAAAGKVSLRTAPGIQLDSDAALAAAKASGLSFKSLDIPAWAAETVWVVQVTGGS